MAFWDSVKKALVGNAPEPKPAKVEAPVAAAPVVQVVETPSDGTYRKCQIVRGQGGWGGPLVIAPRPGKDLIYSVTGGGIHPLAQRIADVTGGKPFDGFRSKAAFEQIAVAVIDCGGTARVGVYPMKGILTVDIHPTSPAGPLVKFINAQNFVSGVRNENVIPIE